MQEDKKKNYKAIYIEKEGIWLSEFAVDTNYVAISKEYRKVLPKLMNVGNYF